MLFHKNRYWEIDTEVSVLPLQVLYPLCTKKSKNIPFHFFQISSKFISLQMSRSSSCSDKVKIKGLTTHFSKRKASNSSSGKYRLKFFFNSFKCSNTNSFISAISSTSESSLRNSFKN